MVDPFAAAATAGAVMRYVLPAIRDLGERVLEASEDAAGNAVVGFGKRLLRAMLVSGSVFTPRRWRTSGWPWTPAPAPRTCIT
jgi:hypothetical protein